MQVTAINISKVSDTDTDILYLKYLFLIYLNVLMYPTSLWVGDTYVDNHQDCIA